MNKWLFHKNGFTRNMLSATVTQKVIVLRKMCFSLYIVEAPNRVHSVTHYPTSQIRQLQCTQHAQSIE